MKSKIDRSQENSAILAKILSAFVIIVCLIVAYIILFLTNNGYRFHRFESVQIIDNWDVTVGSRTGDFDNDGKDDLIDSTGCAFLTKANVGDIDQSSRCRSIYSDEVYKGKYPSTGQTFVFSKDYTYVAKNRGKWEIHSAKGYEINVYKISSNGLLEKMPVKFTEKIDRFVYDAVLAPASFIDTLID